MTEYQPYYVAFAAAHGSTPAEMPKGARGNFEYIRWIMARWTEFRALRPDCFHKPTPMHPGNATEAGQQAFASWLAAKYPVRGGAKDDAGERLSAIIARLEQPRRQAGAA